MPEKSKAIDRAKENLKLMVERMEFTHEVGRTCNEFVGGEQWKDAQIQDRRLTNRPMITINKLANFVNIVVNQNTMERARIKVSPFEDADADTAKVITGLMRHIQYSDKSDAKEAYSHGFFNLTTEGYGYWRVDTEYSDDMSFDQDIVIKKIQNPRSVYMDPEGKFTIIIKWISKDSFKEKYPGKEPGTWDNVGRWESTKDNRSNKDEAMIVEYWECVEKPIKIHKIEKPDVVEIEGGIDIDTAINATTQPQADKEKIKSVTEDELQKYLGWVILEERESVEKEVKQYLFSANDELESHDWAGKFIPIIGCFSRKFTTRNGYEFYKPLVFDSIDPQKMYNFYRSQDAELMQMAPKSPWIGVEGQFDGHEDEWSASNIDHVPYLEYKQVTVDGNVAPPPQRTAPPQPSVGYYQNIATASEEIKATTGLQDASLGMQGNEQSARAINARKQQGNLSTYHFTDFHNEALRQTAIVLLDLIPRTYDTARTIRILGEDLTDEVIKINQEYTDRNGKPLLYDLTTGKYDVKIETGPSSITRRQDARDGMIEIANAVPGVGQVIGDYIVENTDFEKSDEAALRVKASLPPELLDRARQLEDSKNGGPSPEQLRMMQMNQQLQGMQGQMMQMGQGLKQLTQENRTLKNKITQDKIIVEKIKGDFDIRVEKIKGEYDLMVENIKQANKPPTPSAVVPSGGRT